MKTKSMLKRYFIIVSLSVAVACISFVLCTGQKLNKTALQAYELRMNGQADSAKVILEQVLSEDSTNAVAWYEIARTKHHMGLEDISELISGGMADIQQTVQKAVENDPDNVIYQYYKGLINYSILYLGLKTGKGFYTFRRRKK